jgi:hypothetical protein
LAIIAAMPWSLASRLGAALALQLVAPALTVAFRLIRQHRIASVLPGVFLYWLYYVARMQAVALIGTGQARRYRK